MNEDKLYVYIAGVIEDVKDFFIQFSGFAEGFFFMKYLGVFLLFKKWSVFDFYVITDKITKRMIYWIFC